MGNSDDSGTWGSYKPDALSDRVAAKNGKYLRWHHQQGYLFLPLRLVCTTLGGISEEAVRLLFLFAHRSAETAAMAGASRSAT